MSPLVAEDIRTGRLVDGVDDVVVVDPRTYTDVIPRSAWPSCHEGPRTIVVLAIPALVEALVS